MAPAIVLIGAVLSVIIDQVIKYNVVLYLKPVADVEVIPGLFNLTYLENRGAAFGFLADQRCFFIVMTAVAMVVLLVILFRFKHHNFISYTAVSLIIGGGIGNLIDRILNGFVVDYLHISFFPPIFNFADCCVVVGTLFLFIFIFFFYGKEKKPGGVSAPVDDKG